MSTRPHTVSDSVKQLTALTERQRQVATLACQGLSNKIIGAQLGVAEGTIKIHLHAIYDQLGVHSRTQLIAFLADRGD
jgi:two-component system nitrate/nitrite response regulator NarL